jgi:hypothetical protein
VRRSAFKKGSTPLAVAMPSHSSHSSHISAFRAPRWGAPVLPSFCYCLRSATPWGLVLSSRRSASRIFIMQPGCIPPPMVIQEDDHSFVVGKGEPSCGLPLPSASRMFIIHAGEEGAPSWGPAFRAGWRPASSFNIQGRRVFTSLAKEANCRLLPGQGAAVRPSHGRRSCRAQVPHVHSSSSAAGHTGGRTRRRTPRGRCPRS